MKQPDSSSPLPRDDEADYARIEAMLRSVDPGREAAKALSQKSRDRVLWSCRHPFLAWCMLHHRLMATLVAAVLLVLLFFWLLGKSRETWENNRLPDEVSPPIQLTSPLSFSPNVRD